MNNYSLQTLTRLVTCTANWLLSRIFYSDKISFLVSLSLPNKSFNIFGSHIFAINKKRDNPLSSKYNPYFTDVNFNSHT